MHKNFTYYKQKKLLLYITEVDSYSVQCIPDGLINDIKQMDIELVIWVKLIPNNIIILYLHDFIFIMCTIILILSAVEGLNGFKKLNIKDID